MSFPSSPEKNPLIKEIDRLVDKYRAQHPDIAEDLLRYRSSLLQKLVERKPLEYAKLALQLANLVKFIMDRFP